MGTKYSEIYNRAIFMFSDKDFLKYDDDLKTAILHRCLQSAQNDFAQDCEFDLTQYDDTLEEYTDTLDDESIEILSLGVAYYWMSSKALDSELFKNRMSTKEYTYYSPANLLKEVQTLRKSLGEEFRDKIIDYSFAHGDIASKKA